MRILIVSESPADEAALRVIVEALLGEQVAFVSRPLRVRAGGVDAAMRDLGIIYRALYFRQEADVLVFVVDSDNTPVHRSEHGDGSEIANSCRFCRAQSIIKAQRETLPRDAGYVAVTVALGLAVPAIEAWLLYGINRHVGEVQWEQAVRRGKPLFTVRELKMELYGTSSPALDIETEKMREAARRIACDLEALERWFPGGFGPLAGTLKELSTPEEESDRSS